MMVLPCLIFLLTLTHNIEVAVSTESVFLETPSSINVTVGAVAEFNCTSDRASSLIWLVNGSLLEDPDLDESITEIPENGNNIVKTTELFVPIMVATTNTTVECVAQEFVDVPTGTITLFSGPAILMAQGPPDKISGVDATLTQTTLNGSIHLSWTPPPTIDLTNVDPDIMYNVTIVANTSYEDTVTIMIIDCEECPVISPEYTFQAENNPCIVYNFSVFAFNAAGRGKSVSINTRSITTAPRKYDLSGFMPNTSTAIFGGDNQLNMEIKLPELASVDDICYFILNNTILGDPIAGGMTFTIMEHQFNNNYTVNVSACNVKQCTPYAGNIEFSTHDLQQVFINDCSNEGVINITGVFAQNSPALGYFIILCSSDGIAEQFVAVMTEFRNSESLFTKLNNVSSGMHRVVLFDIEGDTGRPGSTAAIDTGVEVVDGVMEPVAPTSGILDAEIIVESGSLCVRCRDKSHNILALAFLHHNPLYLEQLLINCLKSSLFCFNDTKDGFYSVALFRINANQLMDTYPVAIEPRIEVKRVPESDSKTSLIAAVVTATTVTAVAVFGIVIIVIVREKFVEHSSRAQARHSSEIVLQSNQVYDVVKQQQRRWRAVQLEPCSAYGVHGDTDAEPEYETVS